MPAHIAKSKAKRIKKRDRVCLCCGNENNLTVDHIIPRFMGGINKDRNLQTLCEYCNLLKGKKIKNYKTSRNSRMYVINWIKSNLNLRNQRYVEV